MATTCRLRPVRRRPSLERRSSSPTDLRRPCTPSRGPASAVLAHPPRVGSLRSSAPDHDLGHLDDESLADSLSAVLARRAQRPRWGGGPRPPAPPPPPLRAPSPRTAPRPWRFR